MEAAVSAMPVKTDRIDARNIAFAIQGVISPVARAHRDVGVAALLEVRIEDRLAGRAPPSLEYLGESAILH
jgi:hypothetical protein